MAKAGRKVPEPKCPKCGGAVDRQSANAERDVFTGAWKHRDCGNWGKVPPAPDAAHGVSQTGGTPRR